MNSSADRFVRAASLLALLLAPALIGCAGKPQPPYTPPPLVVDEAMQRREWERSVAFYPNGDTVSGVNRFPIRTDPEQFGNDYSGAAFDVGASLAQTVALPFTYIFLPPFDPAVYRGDDIPPTYTAMPPMHPGPRLVTVDGHDVDAHTLEVRPPPVVREQQHGPQGPIDTEFQSSPPIPAREE